MIVSRVTRVANPGRRVARARPKKKSERRSTGNPAHLLTLGFNPKTHKRRKTVAVAKARPKNRKRTSNARRTKSRNRKAYGSAVHRAVNHRRRSNRRRNARTRVVVMAPRRNHRRKSRNPSFMGSSVSVTRMAELVAAGLIGVAINQAIQPMLPTSITGTAIGASVAAVVVAVAEWWAGSLIDKDLGAAAGFGGLMYAGSVVLNQFIPSVGSYVSLSGRRGAGDFVPGRFAVPQNPVTDAMSGMQSSGGLGQGAYPMAYGRVA